MSKELCNEVNGEGEHVGVVLLSCDGVERLQVPQLKSSRRLIHYIGSFTQDMGSILFTFSRYDLQTEKEGEKKNRGSELTLIKMHGYVTVELALALASLVASASAAIALCSC